MVGNNLEKVCILGAGSWGTSQAILLSKKANQVAIWGRPEDDVDYILNNRENKRYLPGITIPDNVTPTTMMSEAVAGAQVIITAVPSQSIRTVITQLAQYLSRPVYIVNTAKGIENHSGKRMSQVIEDVLGKEIRKYFAVLSGPSHAEEVARQVPTAVTLGAFSRETAFCLQDIYMSPSFRVYTNPDVPGVELGGALKNVVALATGIAAGLGYGDNTMAALITRGLNEMIRMGEAMGGNPRTFSGLSGIGDLIVTCSSKYSRNRRAGLLIGQGYSVEDTIKSINMVIESIPTTEVVHRLAEHYGLDMPINTACYNVLFNHWPPAEEVKHLMNRSKKHEIEQIASNIYEW